MTSLTSASNESSRFRLLSLVNEFLDADYPNLSATTDCVFLSYVLDSLSPFPNLSKISLHPDQNQRKKNVLYFLEECKRRGLDFPCPDQWLAEKVGFSAVRDGVAWGLRLLGGTAGRRTAGQQGRYDARGRREAVRGKAESDSNPSLADRGASSIVQGGQKWSDYSRPTLSQPFGEQASPSPSPSRPRYSNRPTSPTAAPTPEIVRTGRQRKAELEALVSSLAQEVESSFKECLALRGVVSDLHQERDFYYSKLREIEYLCGSAPQDDKIAEEIIDILAATSKAFEQPRNDDIYFLFFPVAVEGGLVEPDDPLEDVLVRDPVQGSEVGSDIVHGQLDGLRRGRLITPNVPHKAVHEVRVVPERDLLKGDTRRKEPVIQLPNVPMKRLLVLDRSIGDVFKSYYYYIIYLSMRREWTPSLATALVTSVQMVSEREAMTSSVGGPLGLAAFSSANLYRWVASQMCSMASVNRSANFSSKWKGAEKNPLCSAALQQSP
jgi:hypothetical protein